ncbi:protein starmaker [Cucumis melo var. makuwa]|uniref:Protein starmaker n=1 Tax=Cucumis melo var. makuwa TaxID=1194695 RepID=A0A5A7TI13_CUCMM|nr:protein starmaker [Cucumis melo var. makuwa]
MLIALTPSQNALVSDRLLRHSNINVKVAVAACVSEITRIIAPNAPYSDGNMKEVFHLIVSSFENLSDKSSRSYVKCASILETVPRVKAAIAFIWEKFPAFSKELGSAASVLSCWDFSAFQISEEGEGEMRDSAENHHRRSWHRPAAVLVVCPVSSGAAAVLLCLSCCCCPFLFRYALDRGAALLKVVKLATRHNAIDMAETVLLDILRGDIARLSRCTAISTDEDGPIPRCKPFNCKP